MGLFNKKRKDDEYKKAKIVQPEEFEEDLEEEMEEPREPYYEDQDEEAESEEEMYEEQLERPKRKVVKQQPQMNRNPLVRKTVEEPKVKYVDVPVVLSDEKSKLMVYENNLMLREIIRFIRESNK